MGCVAGLVQLHKVVTEVGLEGDLPLILVANDAELGRASLEAWLSGVRDSWAGSIAKLAVRLRDRDATRTAGGAPEEDTG